MDYPTVYDGGDIKCGYYFVESENYFPLRGNGWYNYTLINYCIEQNIKIKITHQFTSSYTLKHDHFKNFSEYLIDACGSDNSFAKKIINSMVGCWNINKSKYEQISFTLDKYEASRELCRDNVMVTSTDLEDMTLYSVIENKEIKKDDLCSPLYHQILAMEAIELHKLQTFIIKNGGTPLELNTDSILYSGPKINIDGHYYDKECKVEKYRYDETSTLKVDSVCHMVRTGSVSIKEFNYNIVPSENREFIDIIDDVITSNKGCLITGIAGTGKTYFANLLVSELEKKGKVVGKKIAPTNKAASHIKGETIHKFFMSLMLSQNYEKKLLKNLNNFDYIVVDEISMVKEVFYRFFTIIRRYAPNVKFIVVGDFEQFKPVQDTYDGTYEHSPALHQLCDGQRVNLITCKRSDDELFNLYSNKENIENINLDMFKATELTPLNIAYTHKTRKSVNKRCMNVFKGDVDFLTCGPSIYNKKTQDVMIYEGLPIVAYKNIQKEHIFNSEVFHITSIDMNDKTFSFNVGDEVKTFKAHEFKNIFYPAYCITAHVSQGATFKDKYTIHDWNHPRMDLTAKYVSLSRATSINNIQINI
jgi:DNA replication protein DnaC